MATYSDPAMQQNQTPSHLEMGSGDVYYLKSDILKQYPNLLPTYYRQGGKQMTTMEMLNLFQFGRLSKAPSHSPFTQHWEKPIMKNLVHVGSIAAGTKTSEAIITLDAADMFTVDNGYGGTYAKSRPRETEQLDIGIAGLKFRITSKNRIANPNTITVESSDGSNPRDVISAGSVLNIVSTISGEGTKQPTSLQPLRYQYQNTFAIVKETDIVTGSNLTTKVAFNVVPGSNKLYLDGMDDMEIRHQYQKGQVWLFGSQATDWNDYSDLLEEQVPILGTEGLYDGVANNGYNVFYDNDTFGEADLRDLVNYYQSINLSTTNILLMQGITARQYMEDAVRDRINYTWAVGISDEYIMRGRKEQWGAALGKDYNPEGMFINMGISGVVETGYTFLMKGLPEFNNDYGAGAVGDYKKTMIAAPMGYAADAEHTPYIGYEYRGTDGYNRENEVWYEAGAGNKGVVTGRGDFYKTMQYDGVKYYLRSEIAPHFSLLNQFSLIRPASASS